MGNLCVFESISVDGYFCDARGDLSWAHAARQDPEFAAWVGNNASGGRALLLGRVTYELMEAFWPTPAAAQQMPVVAKGMNAAPKYVVSRALEPTWHNTTALRSIDAVRELKQQRDITVLGSGNLVAQLGAAGLVDQYQFVIVPVALGGGRTVFTAKKDLRLDSERTFKNGNVVVTYAAA